VQVQRT